jgi:hypothetical protein
MTRWTAACLSFLAACSNEPIEVEVEAIDCTNEVTCGQNAACRPFDGRNRCECEPGYRGDGTTCNDVDECTDQTDDCVSLATCSNEDGGFVCVCDAGYQGDGRESGNGCTNVDECYAGTDDCVSEATCSDTDGDYDCDCPSSTHGDGLASGSGCVDDNECILGTDDCVSVATCQDATGGYTCACDPGYTGDGTQSGNGCTDVNECSVGSDDCVSSASCDNEVGGYHCDCPTGYQGDGTHTGSGCTDSNECTDGSDDCVAAAQCIDEDGTFDCQCTGGYTGDGHSGGTGCTDINECSAGTADCVSLATCRNEVPGYRCECDSGYAGDGLSTGNGCGDINECNDGSDDCDTNATCTNTPAGSFTCTCDSGWDGDGKSCDPVGWHEANPSPNPGRRWWPAAAGVAGTGVVIYGGYTGTETTDDSWRFDGSNWLETCDPCAVGPRSGHNLVYDSANDRLLLFGGSTTNVFGTATNELWEGLSGGVWTRLTPGGTAPSARWGAAAVFDESRGRLVVFGGQDTTGTQSNEVFEYDGTDWVGPLVTADSPAARDGAAAFYLLGFTYIYGGEGVSGYLDDLAWWDGTIWASVADVTARARTTAVMFVPPGDQLPRIATGYDGDEIAGTWVSTSIPLVVESATLPPARDSSALAYDSDRDVFVLYGGNGSSCGGNCNETWEYHPYP